MMGEVIRFPIERRLPPVRHTGRRLEDSFIAALVEQGCPYDDAVFEAHKLAQQCVLKHMREM